MPRFSALAGTFVAVFATAFAALTLAGCGSKSQLGPAGLDPEDPAGPLIAQDHCAGAEWGKMLQGPGAPTIASMAVGPDCGVVVLGTFSQSVDFGTGAVASTGGTDVVLLKLGKNGQLVWAKTLGDGSDQAAASVAVARDGSVFLSGPLQGYMSFSGNAISSDDATIYLAKLDANGTPLWVKGLASPESFSTARVAHVATDPFGGVVLRGSFTGLLDFGSVALQSVGGADFFVARIDEDGDIDWARRYGDGGAQTNGGGLAVDSHGNTVLVGSFQGGIDFGAGAFKNQGDDDVYVVKLDSKGNTLWAEQFGDVGFQAAGAVTTDPEDNIVFVGNFDGTLDFGEGGLTSTDGFFFNVFVAKLTSEADAVWSRAFGQANAEEATAVTTSAEGEVFVAGNFAGDILFGDTAMKTLGAWDVFVAHLTAESGEVVSADHYGNPATQWVTNIAVDPTGHVTIAGNFDGSLAVGEQTLASGDGDSDVFIIQAAR